MALTGGTFTGPELNGKLLPDASADWQIVLAAGTALGGRGEEVDASEYTFRTSTLIETVIYETYLVA